MPLKKVFDSRIDGNGQDFDRMRLFSLALLSHSWKCLRSCFQAPVWGEDRNACAGRHRLRSSLQTRSWLADGSWSVEQRQDLPTGICCLLSSPLRAALWGWWGSGAFQGLWVTAQVLCALTILQVGFLFFFWGGGVVMFCTAGGRISENRFQKIWFQKIRSFFESSAHAEFSTS